MKRLSLISVFGPVCRKAGRRSARRRLQAEPLETRRLLAFEVVDVDDEVLSIAADTDGDTATLAIDDDGNVLLNDVDTGRDVDDFDRIHVDVTAAQNTSLTIDNADGDFADVRIRYEGMGTTNDLSITGEPGVGLKVVGSDEADDLLLSGSTLTSGDASVDLAGVDALSVDLSDDGLDSLTVTPPVEGLTNVEVIGGGDEDDSLTLDATASTEGLTLSLDGDLLTLGDLNIDLDRIDIANINTGSGDDTIDVTPSHREDLTVNIDGGDGNDTLTINADRRGIIRIGSGSVEVGDTTINSANVEEVAFEGFEVAVITGTDGDDVIDASQEGVVTVNGVAVNVPDVELLVIRGGAGNDTLIGGSGRDFLLGDEGDDELIGNDGHDLLWGGDGNDLLDGGAGRDLLHGGDGDDILLGGDDRDHLFGNDGDDLLVGGADRDQLHGGRGENLLIGGDIVSDDRDAALDALAAIWLSDQTLDEKITAIEESDAFDVGESDPRDRFHRGVIFGAEPGENENERPGDRGRRRGGQG